MNEVIEKITVKSNDSLKDVIERIDRGQLGAALVVGGTGEFLNLITDGDVRRAILAGVNLGDSVDRLLGAIATRRGASAITAPAGTSREHLLELMLEKTIRHLPLVDAGGRLVDLVHLPDLVAEKEMSFEVLILAGGAGKRLRPLTESVPKPMLPLGDRPLVERLVRKLRGHGFRHFHIATHHLADQIHEHFGQLDLPDTIVEFIHEAKPLGTGGALKMLKNWGKPLLVINADVVTTVDFDALCSYHREAKRAVTVCLRSYHVDIPYGVVELLDGNVTGLSEKPKLTFFVNAGVYVVEPTVLQHVAELEVFDMTDLISRLLQRKIPVSSFPIFEYWLDVGHTRDYQQAQDDLRDGRLSL